VQQPNQDLDAGELDQLWASSRLHHHQLGQRDLDGWFFPMLGAFSLQDKARSMDKKQYDYW